MATTPTNAGIMGLPEAGMDQPAPAMSAPQITPMESYDAMNEALQITSPPAAEAVQKQMKQMAAMLSKLPPEVLDLLLQTFQYMLQGPEQYAEGRQILIEKGVLRPDQLPEEFSENIVAVLAGAVLQAKKDMGGAPMPMDQGPMPPAKFAQGGIAEAARMVAAQGRSGDTVLAHINPQEAAMLRRMGGVGTINPLTGLPEYGWLSDAWNTITGGVSDVIGGVVDIVGDVVGSVVDVVKDVVSSPIGNIITTVALTSMGMPMWLSSGVTTLAGGGSLKDAIINAGVAYLGSPGGVVDKFLPGSITNVAARAALSTGLVGAGAGLLQGKNLADSIKSGLIAGASAGAFAGLRQGFDTNIGDASDMTYTIRDAKGNVTGNILEPAVAPAVTPTTDPLKVAKAASEVDFTGRSNLPPGGYPPAGVQTTPPAGARTPAGDVAALQTPPPPVRAYKVPSFTESMSGGIKDLAGGEFSSAMDKFGEAFFPSGPTAAQTTQAKIDAYNQTRAQLVAGGVDPAAAEKAATAAMGNVTLEGPGFLREYGPATAAGVGALAAMGGFSPQPSPNDANDAKLREIQGDFLRTPGQRLAESPTSYYRQRLPGYQYDESGRIIGYDPALDYVRRVEAGRQRYIPQYVPTLTTATNPYALNANQFMANGGLAGLPASPANRAMRAGPAMGIAQLRQGGYPRRVGAISGPGTEKSDNIPAMLSDGEFVMTAKAVRGMGDGSRTEGAKRMYALMNKLENNASRA